MMDKFTYYPSMLVSSFFVRGATYPLITLRTRLQVQKQKDVYSGAFDACKKIFKGEGVAGFYKGFLLHNLTILSGLGYITIYEGSRSVLTDYCNVSNRYALGYCAGACASLGMQPLTIPIDIVTQHRQMQGMQSTTKIKTIDVIEKIYNRHGIMGFYKGTLPSAFSYALSSGGFWFAYTSYGDIFAAALPSWVPHSLLLPLAGASASVSVALVFNPIDLVRTRVQVTKQSPSVAASLLWKEEGMAGLFTKGFSARAAHSALSSTLVIGVYEFIKRLSVLPEYRHLIRW